MYINPIHSAHVTLAQGFALASRARMHLDVSETPKTEAVPARRHRFRPFNRLAHWLQPKDGSDGPMPDPAQLMLWSECAGRPYVTALGGLLVMRQLLKRFTNTAP
jgi:hypothetical protein